MEYSCIYSCRNSSACSNKMQNAEIFDRHRLVGRIGYPYTHTQYPQYPQYPRGFGYIIINYCVPIPTNTLTHDVLKSASNTQYPSYPRVITYPVERERLASSSYAASVLFSFLLTVPVAAADCCCCSPRMCLEIAARRWRQAVSSRAIAMRGVAKQQLGRGARGA